MVLAATASYPWWYIAVFFLGAGGFGTALWIGVGKIYKGAKGITELLTVLRGDEGGKGKRKVAPLVDVVDSLVKTVDGVVDTQTEQTETMAEHGRTLDEHTASLSGLTLATSKQTTDILALRAEITPNGGNTDRIGDRVLRTEEGLKALREEVARRS